MKSDSNTTIAIGEYHFSEEDVFGSPQGLGVAVSLIDFYSSEELVLDKSTGELYFSSIEWGFEEDGKPFFN